MNRDTAIARWYRRVDPRCFMTGVRPTLATKSVG